MMEFVVDNALWIVAAALLVIFSYLFMTRNFDTFSNVGIPGPKPVPILGTALLTMDTNLPTHDTEMWKKYGKFVGTFAGTMPNLLVFDAEWLQEAFIKHFDVLTDRNAVKFGGALDSGILSIKGDHWRFARKLLSPVFTSGKLKQMMPLITERVDIFCDILQSSNEEAVDMRKVSNLLTLDIISSTAFGMKSDVQRNVAGDFAQNAFLLSNSIEANSTISERIRLSLVVFMILLAPEWLMALLNRFFNVGLLNSDALGYYERLIEQVLEERTHESSTPHKDLLQLMSNNEAELQQEDSLVDEDGARWTTKGLTRKEVMGNSILFLFAGFQTTADSMMFIFYELAHHPLIQERLYEEITSICGDKEITHEQVNQLTYLDYCVKEALRLYPQGFRFDRYATQEIEIQGIKIPRGTTVVASSYIGMLNTGRILWTMIQTERFSDTAARAYMPFGIGNRSCIGSRLGMLEMKITVIATVRRFVIQKNSLTPGRPMKFAKAVPLTPLLTQEPIKLSFTPRPST